MRWHNKLGVRIGIYFLSAVLLPFLGVFLLLFFQAKQSTYDLIEKNMSMLIVEMGAEIERTIFTACTNIKLLAKNPVLMSETSTIEEKLDEMRKIQDFYRLFEDITLVNIEGVVITSTTFNYQGEWQIKEWFNQAKKGEVVVSPPHVIISPFRVVIVATAPIYGKDGEVNAVVAGQINMEKIWNITDRFKIGKTGFIFLTDRFGNFITSPRKDRIFFKLEPASVREKILGEGKGMIEYVDEDNKRKLCFFDTIRGNGSYFSQQWRIGIIQNVKETFMILGDLKQGMVKAAGLGVVFIVLLSAFLTNNVVLPVRKLVEATERIRKGDWKIKVETKTKDEIAELGNAFNAMVDYLSGAREELITAKNYTDSIIKSMMETLIVVTPAGIIKTVNNAALELLGYSEEELIGHPIGKVFNEDDFDAGLLVKILEKDKIRNYEIYYKAKNGGKIPVLFNGAAIRDEKGEIIIWIVCSARDITLQKQDEKRLRRYTERLESFHEIDTAILAAQSLESVAEVTSKHMFSLLSCQLVSLTVLNDERNEVKIVATYTKDKLWEKGRIYSLETAGDIEKFREGKGEVIDDIWNFPQSIPLVEKLQIKELKLRSFVIIPLVAEDSLVGLLILGAVNPSAFNFEHEEIAREVANQLGIVIQETNLREKLENSYLESILSLAKAMDSRDSYTADHSQRMAYWSELTARQLGCNEEEIQVVRLGAVMHDIGKIGVPDKILHKPGPLDKEEWEIMKRHPQIGAEIIEPLHKFKDIGVIVRSHHERYDGSGYPDGLKGGDIPFGARILTVVDAYCAMIDDRVYRKALTHSQAVEELKKCSGSHFDPKVIEAFLKVFEKGIA